MDVFPAAPAEGEPVIISVSGRTPNLSSSYPMTVHVNGTTIDVTMDVFVGGATLVGGYRQTEILDPLPAGTYTVNVYVRWVDVSICRAQTRFTVGAGPRRRAT